jgi:hypothetical protein
MAYLVHPADRVIIILHLGLEMPNFSRAVLAATLSLTGIGDVHPITVYIIFNSEQLPVQVKQAPPLVVTYPRKHKLKASSKALKCRGPNSRAGYWWSPRATMLVQVRHTFKHTVL